MITAKTKRMLGKKLHHATEFVLELLAQGEMPREEVYQLAARRGITEATLARAKQAVKVKIRRAGGKWYMSLPCDARENIADYVRKKKQFSVRQPQRRREVSAVSSDWVTVVADTGEEGYTASLPDRDGGGLHVKVGAVEFTADSAFPVEKLIEVLRGLGVTGGC
jgi:hypothetical protein